MTKNVGRRALVAAVAVACVLTLVAVVAAPAEAGQNCPRGLKLIKWPTGLAPDYNNNGHVCYGYSSLLGTYITIDDR